MTVSVSLSIGNFDGVHRGHARLIEAARSAVGDGGRVIVLAFDPHPLSILRPQAEPPRLTRFDQRAEFLRRLGANEVHPLRPTREFLSQQAGDFIQWLAESYRPAAIVEGPDFHFGRDRTGSIDTLRRFESQFGYRTRVVDPVEVTLTDLSIVRASSSLIRWLLRHGRVRDAGRVLGRPYELRGRVERGDQRGRTLGMPTANLDHGDLLLPADGIYAGLAQRAGGETYPAAISVGCKPTFGASPRICEAHLVDFNGPLDDYGWEMRLEFHDWIRDQLHYRNVHDLVKQLRRDVDATLRLLDASPQPA